MSNFYIDIIDRPIYYLNIETSIGTITNTIEIEKFNDYNLELVNVERVLASDLPDDIPMSKIIGNLHWSRITDLDEHVRNLLQSGSARIHVDELVWGDNNIGLDGYLNTYEFDCGSP